MVDGNPLGTEFDALVEQLKTYAGQFSTSTLATDVNASAIKGKLAGGTEGLGNNTVQTKVKDLVVQIAKKFGLYDVSTTDITVKSEGANVEIGGSSSNGKTANAEVKVKIGESDSAIVTTVNVKAEAGAKTESRANRLAWTVGDAIAKALSHKDVKEKIKSRLSETDEEAKAKVDSYRCNAEITSKSSGDVKNVLSPFLLFIVGSFAEFF